VKTKLLTLVSIGAFSLAGFGSAFAEEDPTVGNSIYFGSGKVEMAPEFGTLSVTISTDCKITESAARVGIKQIADNIWRIVSEKLDGSTSETDNAHWNDIQTSFEEPISVRNDKDGKLFRFNHCTLQSVPWNAPPVAKVFRASQSFGVTSSDLDWLERFRGLAKKLGNVKDKISVSSNQIRYDVSSLTRQEMQSEVKQQAFDEAVGDNSKFEQDKTERRYQKAFLKQVKKVSSKPNQVRLWFSGSDQQGNAPRVQLSNSFEYTIYVETKDKISEESTEQEGGIVKYTVSGKAHGVADFGVSQITLQTGCHTTQESAKLALNPAITLVKSKLETFIPDDGFSETEGRIVYDTRKYQRSQVQVIESGKNEFGQYIVLEYRDNCTGEVHHPQIEGTPQGEYKKYWQASKRFVLKSARFEALQVLLEETARQFGAPVAENGNSQVLATILAVNPQVLEKTRRVLELQSRANADRKLLSANGEFQKDKDRYGFTSAYLVEAAPSGSVHSGGGVFSHAQSDSVYKSEDEAKPLNVNSRPPLVEITHFRFEFKMKTENYVDER